MEELREIFAAYDESVIEVYQAFCPDIAEEVLRVTKFGRNFQLTRMSWIKPSFGWMLYRSHYGTLTNQERILKITMDRSSFDSILGLAVASSFDPRGETDIHQWRTSLRTSEVRYQWDPDRNVRLERLNRRAIQLGLRGSTLESYAHRWIVRVTDVTDLAHSLSQTIQNDSNKLPDVSEERVYPVSETLRRHLGMKVQS